MPNRRGMSSQHLALLSVMIMAVMGEVYHVVKNHYNGSGSYEKKMQVLEKEIEHQEFVRTLILGQFSVFRQQVASIVPDMIKEKDSLVLRNLASVVQKPDRSKLSLGEMKAHFDDANELFKKAKYFEASRKFQTYLQEYPFSADLPRAYFLLAESQFQLRYFNDCIETIQSMVELYPDNELTGYALLRMGSILEFQDRPEEALEVYKTVLTAFGESNLAVEAKRAIASVNLNGGT